MRLPAGILAMRLAFGHPERYLYVTPAWLECYREDFRGDIEAEYLVDQRQAEESARRESQ